MPDAYDQINELVALAGQTTRSYPDDVVAQVQRALGKLSGESDSTLVAEVVRAAGRVYGRLGETILLQDLIVEYKQVADSELQFELQRHLLNAAAVIGDVTLAESVFSELTKRRGISGKPVGAYLRAIWARTGDIATIIRDLKALALQYPMLPEPVGLVEAISGDLDRRLARGAITALCTHGPDAAFRFAVDSGSVDDALALLLGRVNAIELHPKALSELVTLLGKDGRLEDVRDVLRRLGELCFPLRPDLCTALYRTATAYADETLIDAADQAAANFGLNARMATSAATAYASVGRPERVVAIVRQYAEATVLERKTYETAVQACLRHDHVGAAIELIVMDPLGIAAEVAPTIIIRAVDELVKEKHPELGLKLIRAVGAAGGRIPDAAWMKLLAALSTAADPETPAVLLDALMAGAQIGGRPVAKVLHDLARSGTIRPSQFCFVLDAYRRAGLDLTVLQVSEFTRHFDLAKAERPLVIEAFANFAAKGHARETAAMLRFDVSVLYGDPEAIRAAAVHARGLTIPIDELRMFLGDDADLIRSDETAALSADGYRRLLDGLRHAGMLGDMRSLFDRIINDRLLELNPWLWEVLLSAYVGHHRGAAQAKRLVELAAEHNVVLTEREVILAIRACGRDLRRAEAVVYRSWRAGWIEKSNRTVALRLAGIAATTGNTGKAYRHLAGKQAEADGHVTTDFASTKKGDWWAVYLRTLAHSDSETFEAAWAEYSVLCERDRGQLASTRRTRTAAIWAAYAVHLAIHGESAPGVVAGDGSPDVRREASASERAIAMIVDRVLTEKTFRPDDALFEIVLTAEWPQGSKRAIARFNAAVGAGSPPAAAWMQTRSLMAAESGEWRIAREVLDHLELAGDAVDEQLFWVELARACANSNDPAGHAEMGALLEQMNARGLSPTPATLSRFADAARTAGATPMLNAIRVIIRDQSLAVHLTEQGKLDLANKLIVGYAASGAHVEAISVANQIIAEGRSLSNAARAAHNRALVESGNATAADEVADPRDALKVLALFASDLVHDVATPVQVIRDHRRAAERAALNGDLSVVGVQLTSIQEGLTFLTGRIKKLREFSQVLREQRDDGLISVSCSLRRTLNTFASDRRTLADLAGIPLQVRFESSIAGNNQYLIRAPELFIDMAVKNVVRNAATALRSIKNPSITISVRDTNERTDGFPHGFVSLSVIDNGPGIPEPTRMAIFRSQPLSRGREGTAGGVGTGLLLVSTLAHVIDARLDIPLHQSGATVELRIHPYFEGQI